MTTNKELIQRLTNYFLEQDKETVCRLLANSMIDFNRILNYDKLSENEKNNLEERVVYNNQQLHTFAVEGTQGPLECILINPV